MDHAIGMTEHTTVLPGAAAMVMSVTLVGVVRIIALRTRMLDIPGTRSSHDRPVPRGGGAGLIAAIVLSLGLAGHATGRLAAAIGAVVAVAVVGWIDDRRSLRAVPRLAVHLLAGVVIAWAAGGAYGPLGIGGVAAVLWWVFWTLAMINVTNFMDGIDGLVASQMAVFGLHLWWNTAPGGSAGAIGAALAGACAGFLVWNWAPARIFLGDVGSGALGATAALGGALAVRQGDGRVELVFLPLLPFFLDATVTLVRRAARGERLWEAHRLHLYQRLANGAWGHARTTLVYMAAALAGVLVLRTGTSYRSMAISLYVGLVVGGALLLERQSRALGSSDDAPSP